MTIKSPRGSTENIRQEDKTKTDNAYENVKGSGSNFEALKESVSSNDHQPLSVSSNTRPSVGQQSPSWNSLIVPRAHDWTDGTALVDSESKEAQYVVAHEEDLGSKSGQGPNCVAVIATPARNTSSYNDGRKAANGEDASKAAVGDILAVVRSTNKCLSGFTIYTMEPNFEGQEATTMEDVAVLNGQAVYKYGRLRQSALGGTYTFRKTTGPGRKDHTQPMKARNGKVSCALLLCGFPFLCSKWNMEFVGTTGTEKGNSHTRCIRSQRDESLDIAPGQDPLVAVCLAYAVDRLTNPCHSTECQNAGIICTAGVLGGVLGALGVAIIRSS